MKPCIYVLTNDNHSVLYTGVTSDLSQRILQHRDGVGNAFTHRYNLHKLVYVEFHPTMNSAISREKQIKSWSRERKVELIVKLNPTWRDLILDNK